ncbi:MAG: hypothetical protein KGD64_07820, partial [Candidatus Heimdallarchaeota archaeon]|nr:hypothetical protein [Candidatus Heimdallarchaeota archaeon]
MKTYKMEKRVFPDFINIIKSKGKLFGPVKQKSKYSFEEINNSSELDFDYHRTILGIKKFLTPPRYKTMQFNKEGSEDIFDGDETNIVMGVHPCDIHSVKILDRLFMANIKDPYYSKKRANLIIIGHSCLPDDKCLCQSTGTDMVEDGFDLFPINTFYDQHITRCISDD